MTKLSVFDVASHILKLTGEITTMKLQKLAYYCQAWHLVWAEKPLFREKIEAWANGPVVRELFEFHKGKFKIKAIKKTPIREPNQEEKKTIDSVVKFYGHRNSQWLSDLTHMEDPWKNARKGMPDSERGEVEITHAAMAEYYSSLPPA